MRWPFTVLAAAIICTPASAREIRGVASVIDADTIEIHGERIRFWGVDAPEASQLCDDATGKPYQCGGEAAMRLDEFLEKNRPLTCLPVDIDRYKRTIATCFTPDQTDIGDWLVRHGLAVDYVEYSTGAYDDAQNAAMKAGAGIWSGDFVMPTDMRRRKKAAATN